MLEPLTMPAAGEYTIGQTRIPDVVVLDAIRDNNTEFKALVQAPLREDQPVPVTLLKSQLYDVSGHLGSITQPFDTRHIGSALSSMNPDFVTLDRSGVNLAAMHTTAGRSISAPMGGHLLDLATKTDIPSRKLIGERQRSRKLPNNATSNDSIETRLRVLTVLWDFAKEDWQAAVDLLEVFEDEGIKKRLAKEHLTSLMDIGIVERREPKREFLGERGLRGYLYRIKQEGNGSMSPPEIVERYLAIILLSSVIDPDFISAGLSSLERISHDSRYVPDLVRRSFDNTAHTGKQFKKPQIEV